MARVPAPKGDPDAPTKALIFDSWYDSYRGVVMLVRMLEGRLAPKQQILLWSNKKRFEVQDVGVFAPKPRQVETLCRGEAGDGEGQQEQQADQSHGGHSGHFAQGRIMARDGVMRTRQVCVAGAGP